MNKKKIIAVLVIIFLLIASLVVWRRESVWTYDEYYDCQNAGYPTIEPSPPTCYHPDGRITPGRPKP